MRLYTIFDSVAETYSPPFIQENDRSAFRSFQVLLRDHPDSAADMKLFMVGSWSPYVVSDPITACYPQEVTGASVMKELESAQG